MNKIILKSLIWLQIQTYNDFTTQYKGIKFLVHHLNYILSPLVIKDMDVNKHERLFNITLRHKLK